MLDDWAAQATSQVKDRHCLSPGQPDQAVSMLWVERPTPSSGRERLDLASQLLTTGGLSQLHRLSCHRRSGAFHPTFER